MAPSARRSTILARRARESARRRRNRDLKVESLEPRLALATGLVSTLVSVVRDDSSHSLLAPGEKAEIQEGKELTASVVLNRRPDSKITVLFKSLAPLELASPPIALTFTRANWNKPQPVTFRSLQDGSGDGDQRVTVKMKTAVAKQPQTFATKHLKFKSLDSDVVSPVIPRTDTFRGSIVSGKHGDKNSGSVQATYDSILNRGSATFIVKMPEVKHFRRRTITVDYSLNSDNTVNVERVEGVAAEKFHLDATYRNVGVDRGFVGRLTVSQPKRGQSATAMMTAAAVPEAVQNLAVAPTGVGSLLLSWNPPAGGATGYTVTMTATTTSYGSGTLTTTTNTTITTTTATSMPFTGLSGSNFYTFAVVANNASGGGAASTVSFGPQTVTVGAEPIAFTKGLDGSIWAVNRGYKSTQGTVQGTVQQIVNVNGTWTAQAAIAVGSNPSAIATGLDGSIWVANTGSTTGSSSLPGTVQQIVNQNGVWTAKPAIAVGANPSALTIGLDGSIWVVNFGVVYVDDSYTIGSVQQIVNINGVWTAQPAIGVGSNPLGITTGLDGSIWVANTGSDNVQQIVNSDGVWKVQTVIGVGKDPTGLTTGKDGSIWVANGGDGTVQQIVSNNNTWTAQSAIKVGRGPYSLATNPDGSIWVVNLAANSIQQIVYTNGEWMAQTALGVGFGPFDLVVADDGSIWVANPFQRADVEILVGSIWGVHLINIPNVAPANTVQRVVDAPSLPINLSSAFGPASGEMTLSWTAPSANGSPIVGYTVTASQGTTSQTITTSSTSYIFSGLRTGQGTTYFTVTASNFAGTSPAAGLLLGPDGNPIPTPNNTGVGIVTDGTPFTGGGFDGDGNAYSWQALGSSPTLAWNGVTFDLGSPNQPNSTVANGQTIPVPQGAYTTLNLAGAAVNGSQQNQQLTLTFTDNSTVVWTQSFSDWGSPQNYGHEAIVSTQTYRDTASGGTQQFTNRVYGYSYTIPAGKTLASITLPKNQNVRLLDIQMSTATSVDLSSSYNSWGIANGSTQVANKQGFDGGGYYYYSANLGPLVAWSGATFNFGAVPTSSKGGNNFVQAKGQTIGLPQGSYGWLYLAGAGANGSQQNQKLTLTFTDDSTATWTQSFSDWCSPSGFSGESIIQQQPNWVNQVGNVHSQTNYVYGYAYEIPAGKTLKSITLPNNTNNLGILGIAMM